MRLRMFRSMDLPHIIRAIMAARDWSQEEFAGELETSQATVSRWLAGAEPKGRRMERIRQLALESGVLEREPDRTNQAPLMGRVGAGAEIWVEYEQPPPDGYDAVELPFSFPDPVIAFQVEGDSMLPAYEAGEVIVCLRDQVRATDHYLGQRAVVLTAAGERYLKRIVRGPKKGLYNLESWNARTIEAVRIEWVGEIIATVVPGAIRRIVRQQASRRPAGPARGKRV